MKSLSRNSSPNPKLTAVWRIKPQKSEDIPNSSPTFKEDGSLLRLLRTKSMPSLVLDKGSPIRQTAPVVMPFSPTAKNDTSLDHSTSSSLASPITSRHVNPRRNLEEIDFLESSTNTSITTPPPSPSGFTTPHVKLMRSVSDGHIIRRRKQQLRSTTLDLPPAGMPSVKTLRLKFDTEKQTDCHDFSRSMANQGSYLKVNKDKQMSGNKTENKNDEPMTILNKSGHDTPEEPTQNKKLVRHESLSRFEPSRFEPQHKEVESKEREVHIPPRSVKSLLKHFESTVHSNKDDETTHTSQRQSRPPKRLVQLSSPELQSSLESDQGTEPETKIVNGDPGKVVFRQRSKSLPAPSENKRSSIANIPANVQKLKMHFERQSGPVEVQPSKGKLSETDKSTSNPHEQTKLDISGNLAKREDGYENSAKAKGKLKKQASIGKVHGTNEQEDECHTQYADNDNQANEEKVPKSPSVKTLRKHFEAPTSPQLSHKDAKERPVRRRHTIASTVKQEFETTAKTPDQKLPQTTHVKDAEKDDQPQPHASVKNLLRQFESQHPKEKASEEIVERVIIKEESLTPSYVRVKPLIREESLIMTNKSGGPTELKDDDSDEEFYNESGISLKLKVQGSVDYNRENLPEGSTRRGVLERNFFRTESSSSEYSGDDEQISTRIENDNWRPKKLQVQSDRDLMEQENRKWEQAEREAMKIQKLEEITLQRERERIALMQVEEERKALEKAERGRIQQEEEQRRQMCEKAEKERLATEKADEEKREREKLQQKERERAEQERRERERAQQERKERERLEQIERERVQREQEEREILERERRKQEKEELERKEQERREHEDRERREYEERERAKQEQRAREQMEQEREHQKELERKEKERAEQEEKERERVAQERREREKAELERKELQRQEKEKAELERKELEREEKEKAEIKIREQEKAEQEKNQQLERESRKRKQAEREILLEKEKAMKEDQEMMVNKKAEKGHEKREEEEEKQRAIQMERDKERAEKERLEREQETEELMKRQKVGKLVDRFTTLQAPESEAIIKGDGSSEALKENFGEGQRESDVSVLIEKFANVKKRSSSASSHSSVEDSSSKQGKETIAPIPTAPSAPAKNVPGKVRNLNADELRFFSQDGAAFEPFVRSQSLRAKKNEPQPFQQRGGSLRVKGSEPHPLSGDTTAMPKSCRQLRPDELRFFAMANNNIYLTKKSANKPSQPQQDFRLGSQDDHRKWPTVSPGDDQGYSDNSDSDSDTSLLRDYDQDNESTDEALLLPVEHLDMSSTPYSDDDDDEAHFSSLTTMDSVIKDDSTPEFPINFHLSKIPAISKQSMHELENLGTLSHDVQIHCLEGEDHCKHNVIDDNQLQKMISDDSALGNIREAINSDIKFSCDEPKTSTPINTVMNTVRTGYGNENLVTAEDGSSAGGYTNNDTGILKEAVLDIQGDHQQYPQRPLLSKFHQNMHLDVNCSSTANSIPNSELPEGLQDVLQSIGVMASPTDAQDHSVITASAFDQNNTPEWTNDENIERITTKPIEDYFLHIDESKEYLSDKEFAVFCILVALLSLIIYFIYDFFF